MFSVSSSCLLGQHGSCSTAQRPGELSENILQNLQKKLPPQTVEYYKSHLLLLDCDDAQDGVGVLVVEGKVRERVVLIVLELDLVAVPSDGRRGVRLDVALEVHVELQRLAKALPRDLWDITNITIEMFCLFSVI